LDEITDVMELEGRVRKGAEAGERSEESISQDVTR
jgi:hypothetical protein